MSQRSDTNALTLPAPIRDAAPQAMAMLRQRCSALGLPTWRCDRNGIVLAEPLETGTLAILLGSAPMTGLITAQARAWGSMERPEVTELFPGCWGIPLPEFRRRDRIGTLVALAMAPESLHEEVFLSLCGSAHLDAQATRRALLPRARFDDLSARTTRDLLLFMAGDLAHIEEHDHTVNGFTNQLTDCYETIDLLYSLGRSMNEVTQPEAFIRALIGRVHTTLNFGFVGACFVEDPRLGPVISDRVALAGSAPPAPDILEPLRRTLLESNRPIGGGPMILTDLDTQPLPGAGQVLALPIFRSGSLVGFIFAGDKQGDDNQVSSYDIQLIEAGAGYLAAFLDNAALYAGQRQLFLGTLEALTSSIDAKDRYTCGHSHRVAHLSSRLAIALGYTAEQADRVRIAGLVHDVGKIGVPESVLTKGGRLTDDEFGLIKQHPAIGHHILKDIPQFEDVLPGVLHHHERWDGRGYPAGLTTGQIPMLARIIALADTFDAMSSNRSYRSALPREQVLAEIRRCAGAQFDPDLVAPFIALDFAQYDAMVQAAAAQSADVRPLATAA